MYKYFIIFIVTLFVSSCAGIQTASQYERNAEKAVTVVFEGKSFVVLDDVAKSSAFVSEDAATDLFKGVVEGAFLTLIDLTAPVGQFEGAMLVYLNENKNGNCQLKRSNFISDNLGGGLGYEIYYECL